MTQYDPRYPVPRYLIDEEHADYIAYIDSGQVGAIAISEQLPKILDPTSPLTPLDHLQAILNRAKRISASRDAKGRTDLVEVGKTRQDLRIPLEMGQSPQPTPEALNGHS